MFVGGKVVEAIELEARQVDLEAQLLENENLVHHFQSVVRNRDQELNSTKRVSTHTETHSNFRKTKTRTYRLRVHSSKVLKNKRKTNLLRFNINYIVIRMRTKRLFGSCTPDRVSYGLLFSIPVTLPRYASFRWRWSLPSKRSCKGLAWGHFEYWTYIVLVFFFFFLYTYI